MCVCVIGDNETLSVLLEQSPHYWTISSDPKNQMLKNKQTNLHYRKKKKKEEKEINWMNRITNSCFFHSFGSQDLGRHVYINQETCSRH